VSQGRPLQSGSLLDIGIAARIIAQNETIDKAMILPASEPLAPQSMLEMNKNAPEILVVFFDAMVELANVRLIQKAQHLFLELPATLARNNFDEIDFLVDSFLYDSIQFRVDLTTAIVNIVQIKL
jgi:hypothetical protein